MQAGKFQFEKKLVDRTMLNMARNRPGKPAVLQLLPGSGRMHTPYISSPRYKSKLQIFAIVPGTWLQGHVFG